MSGKTTWHPAPLALLLIYSYGVFAGEYFAPELLQSVNGNATISDTRFLSKGQQPEGTYRVRIEVNDVPLLASSVRFKLNPAGELSPCLSFTMYQKLGVDKNKMAGDAKDNEHAQTCEPMEKQVPGAKAVFDFAKMQLTVSIPQTVLRENSLQAISEDDWDDGITALLSNYQLSGQQYLKHSATTENTIFANLNNGFNFGPWRYRNNSTLSTDDSWKSISNYVETAIRPLKSELTLGDANTPGDIFDSLLVRGIQLSTDDDMLPDRLTGFAPVIRGIAKGNAQITIRENNNIIYQRSVPPGPFSISDLSSVASSGKLDVTVREADGSESHSVINYGSVPQLLRAHQIQFNLTTGRYLANGNGTEKQPEITQATLSWGLPFETTLYGGSQYNERYKAASLGVGFDLLQLGGFAFDETHDSARQKSSGQYQGDMMRLTYRNRIPEADTQIQIDNRYYRKHYLSFSDWANESSLPEDSPKRREYSITIDQSVSSENSFFATLSRTQNMDNGISRAWQLGWNGALKGVNYSVTLNMMRDEGVAEWDKQLALNFNLPLSSLLANAAPLLSYTSTTGLKGDLSNQMGLSGYVGDRDDLTWNSQLSYASQHGQTDTRSGSLGLDYQSNVGEFDMTWNAERHQYLAWSASGNVLAHSRGITAGRYSAGSMALIEIPGAKDVALGNGQNIHTDSQGYATVPDIQNYRQNSFTLDPESGKSYDFVSTSASVVPTKDAIVEAKFTAFSGHKAVLTVSYDGVVLPFGARAKIDGQQETFYVGAQGQVYLNSAPDKGTVRFHWGDNKQCVAPLILPADNPQQLSLQTLTCH
ncbi:fimbrial biogenesis outer membrane usher protein [Salmonella enterica]|nr:fimbrial biogenesis outer membrane usher protein [Salmonella enterica]EGW2852203.1 fimbrial biogenesis outer membrane usher protein [Salmonella enterica]